VPFDEELESIEVPPSYESNPFPVSSSEQTKSDL